VKTRVLILATAFSMGAVACGPENVETKSNSSNYEAIILNSQEGTDIPFPLHETRELAGYETNVAGMSFFELRIPKKSAGAPPHSHSHEDEFFYVRTGSLTFMADNSRKTISAGGFVLLPRNGLHAFWNSSDEDAIVLVGTSKGEFGDFFDAVAVEARQKQAASPQQIGEIVGLLGAERGIIIDMSKLPDDVAGLYGLK